MIIEHVFITTLDGADALRLASEYLGLGGFRPQTGIPFSISAPSSKLDVVRGKANAARAKAPDELPQRLWLEWDRGRVTVAASIEFFETASFSYGSRKEPPPDSPKLRPHIEMMQAMLAGLEASTSGRLPPADARRPWADVEARLREEWRRRRRRRAITLWLVFSGIVLLIILVIVLTAR